MVTARLGLLPINWKGINGDIECWLNQQGIVNIFSIPILKKLGYRGTYDSTDNCWLVFKDDVTVKFRDDNQGLFYINMGKYGVVIVQTLFQSMEGCINKEIRRL